MSKATQSITKSYLSTTSSRRGSIDEAHYQRTAATLRRRLGNWLPPAGARVLDLGCGLGELMYLAAGSGCKNPLGINLSQEEIDAAEPLVQGRFECADILDYLSRTEEEFDWIGALNILEHLDKDTLLEVLTQAAKHLSPGGVLVAMVPNAISPFGNLTRHWDFTHEWAFTPNNFRQLAPLAGFSQQIEFRECSPVPHGLVSGIRWLLWQGIRLAVRTYFMIETADSKGGVYTMDMMVRLRKAGT